jgi:hypothetical protein
MTGHVRRLVIALMLAVIVLAAVAAIPALANRAATSRERRDIARVAHVRAGCLTIRVSTLRTSARWAVARTKPCANADGVIGLQRKNGRWRVRFEGPNDNTSPCPELLDGSMPIQVAEDLAICNQ